MHRSFSLAQIIYCCKLTFLSIQLSSHLFVTATRVALVLKSLLKSQQNNEIFMCNYVSEQRNNFRVIMHHNSVLIMIFYCSLYSYFHLTGFRRIEALETCAFYFDTDLLIWIIWSATQNPKLKYKTGKVFRLAIFLQIDMKFSLKLKYNLR